MEPDFPPLHTLRREPVPDAAALARLRTALAAVARRSGRRTVVLPLGAAAAACLAIALLTSVLWLLALRTRPLTHGPVERMAIQFVLVATEAHTVSLVGDFNDWDGSATPMVRSGNGVWSATLRLQPGRFTYAYLVDGSEWRADPATATAPSDYGRPSSVVFVSNAEVSF